MICNIPYGDRELKIHIPEERLAGVLVSQTHDYKPEGTESEIVRKSLDNPIGSKSLKELAVGKTNVVIISSDHTRPVPSHITMPLLLEEIRAGNPNANISILISTAMHRASTQEELISKYGEKIATTENIIMHNSTDDASMVKLGILPSGGDLILNKLAVEADLLIGEGFIEPHFFAGFSGGRKSVLPGVASRETILANHCAEFIDSPYARTGILEGNPLHRDMIYAAEKANMAFILNVVIDSKKKVIASFAGHREQAHNAGCDFVRNLAEVDAVKVDVVITSNGGYPLDQNIYQAVKGMTAAEATLGETGVIIIAAECRDGHGGEEFYRTFKFSESIQAIMDEILARGRTETVPDQWQSQIFARVLLKHKVIMVTDVPKEMVEDLHMSWAPSLEAALEMADDILGNKDSKIAVIPDGVSVVVRNN